MMKLGIITLLLWGAVANATEQPCSKTQIATGMAEESIVGVSEHCSPKKVEQRIENSLKEDIPDYEAINKAEHSKQTHSINQIEKGVVKKALKD